MTTALFEVRLKDGRKYRVNCANKSQLKRFRAAIETVKPLVEWVGVKQNGIHTVKEFENHVKYLK